jgi:hypothetical protein
LSALLLVLSNPAHAFPGVTLPFIVDDYARALSEAKRRELPVFVEVSAPW